MIKAIETKYKGYRFRSRLEARWAVFFDFLKIKWDYEAEGFDLGDGLYYLPDFKIKLLKTFIWVEIKFDRPNDLEIKKMHSLLNQTYKAGYVFSGVPGSHSIFEIMGDMPIEHCIEECERKFKSIFQIDPADNLAFLKAVEKAKSARFEFGETP